jgi:hypothetical protein
MGLAKLLPAILLVMVSASNVARADDFTRATNEDDVGFAKRVLHISDRARPHVTSATWNGAPTLFVDYFAKPDRDQDRDRPLVVLQRQPSGAYRLIQVTTAETEGGTPEVVAIGFAIADRDPAKELIVIISWVQNHHQLVSGTLYEVRIFDDLKSGENELKQLSISKHFGMECECFFEDGTQRRFRYKTIEEVKRELMRLGF